MKKVIFKHSNPEIKTITGGDGEDIEVSKALKLTLGMAVGKSSASMEDFRKWVIIGEKLDKGEAEIELEDAQLELVTKLFNAGVDAAFPRMETKALAVEVDRILTEAKEDTKPNE